MKAPDLEVVVITGAGGALGRAVATKVASHSRRLVLVDMDAEAAARTAATLEGVCHSTSVVPVDVSTEQGVREYATEALRGPGKLRAFFNNAGIEGPQLALTEYPVADFDKVIAVNVRSVFLGMRELAPHMSRGASIVNTASTAGLRGNANAIAYIASKHAVVGMTKAAALELAPKDVRVNAYCPGPVRGRMLDAIAAGRGVDVETLFVNGVPLGRLGEPDEHADTVAFLLVGPSDYTTGTTVVVDGGRLL